MISASRPPGRRGGPRRGGLFVTFEGVEGAGKTTQIARLARRLATLGIDAIVTREPGGTATGARLRTILLDFRAGLISPAAELLLYAADRALHIEQVIAPALARGAVVLCDRYLDATLAYQGFGRGTALERILEIHRSPPLDLRPDRTLLLDHDPALGLMRARRRNRQRGTTRSEGRMERESLAFHRSVRTGYLRLAAAEPGRFRVIEAAGRPVEIEALIRAALVDLLPGLLEEPARRKETEGRSR